MTIAFAFRVTDGMDQTWLAVIDEDGTVRTTRNSEDLQVDDKFAPAEFVMPEQEHSEWDVIEIDPKDVNHVPTPTFNPYHDERGRFSTGPFHSADPKDFIDSRNKSSRAGFLNPLVPDDIKNHQLMLNQDSTVGVAVSPEGDVENLFNNGGPKGEAARAMIAAIGNGGTTLDCYDGYLNSYYHQFGFEEVGRLKFDPQFANPAWDHAKNDSPDVVFMRWNGYPEGGASSAFKRATDRSQWVKDKPSKRYFDSYDAAKKVQTASVN